MGLTVEIIGYQEDSQIVEYLDTLEGELIDTWDYITSDNMGDEALLTYAFSRGVKDVPALTIIEGGKTILKTDFRSANDAKEYIDDFLEDYYKIEEKMEIYFFGTKKCGLCKRQKMWLEAGNAGDTKYQYIPVDGFDISDAKHPVNHFRREYNLPNNFGFAYPVTVIMKGNRVISWTNGFAPNWIKKEIAPSEVQSTTHTFKNKNKHTLPKFIWVLIALCIALFIYYSNKK